MGKPKGPDPEELVLNYINEKNRPFNTQMVLDGMHGESFRRNLNHLIKAGDARRSIQNQTIKKTATQKALDSLLAAGKISSKAWNKQVVYFARQDQFPKPSEDDLRDLDAEITTKGETVKQLEAELKTLEGRNKAVAATLTDEALAARIAEFEEKVATATAKAEKLRGGADLINAEDRAKLQKKYDGARLAWRKRKRVSKEMIETISEGMGKKPKVLAKDIGIEADEDVGVVYGEGRVEKRARHY